MDIINDISSIINKSINFNDSGYKIGLVPIMSPLHNGHLSLINNIRTYVDKVIVSIFTNKKQSSKHKDYKPSLKEDDKDCQTLKDLEVDIVYIPSKKEMYPNNFSTNIDIGPLANELCGASQKGYFNEILLSILKLIMQTNPNVIIFGEKNYQMLFLVTKMCQDLNINVEIIQSPTVREVDGLAISSQNVYFTPNERHKANYLFNVLNEIANLKPKSIKELNAAIQSKSLFLTTNGFQIEYLEVRDNNTLSKITNYTNNPSRLFAAAYLGKCRLTDNIILQYE